MITYRGSFPDIAPELVCIEFNYIYTAAYQNSTL